MTGYLSTRVRWERGGGGGGEGGARICNDELAREATTVPRLRDTW